MLRNNGKSTDSLYICFLLFLLRVWMRIGGILPTVVRGPLEAVFIQTWESPVVLYLVIIGSIAIGLSMIFGLFTRLGALGGAVMMVGFYLATIPPQFGWINQYFIYFGAFFNFLVITPEYVLGLDGYLRKLKLRFPVLHWVAA